MILENKIIVTTNVKNNIFLVEKAKEIAIILDGIYIKRERKTIKELIATYYQVIVVYSDKIEYFDTDTKIYFHPDTAIVRIKSKNDNLVNIIKESSQSILDLTLGMGRDSIVLSYFGHTVTAIESNKLLSFLVATGLKNYNANDEKLSLAMRSIRVINDDNLNYLKNCNDNSYDIIYLDPMFEYKIKDSNNLKNIEKFTNKSTLTKELFLEMKRVARKKIIIKAHNKDKVFDKFGFYVEKRAGSKFSYGIYDLGGKDV